MDNNEVITRVRDHITNSGYKLTAISEKTGIEYQRLNRILNQGATLSAHEFLELCRVTALPVSSFTDSPRAG